MTEKINSLWKGIKYGAWTLGAYVLVFLALVKLRPSLLEFVSMDSQTAIWYIFLRTFPYIAAFLLLVTGYSAIKGDRSQIIPAVIHGLATVGLFTYILQGFVAFVF